ncbi:MAG TPA: ATP-binding protein [Dongiaceae bacterium]|nr:ATP-binding protein [Dongiaceae bacterium]
MGNNKDKSQVTAAKEMRRRAEERLGEKPGAAPPPWTEGDPQKLLHELQVHQIELEMQNMELHQSRDRMESALEKYTSLYDFAPMGYVTLDRNGIIRATNLIGSTLLGVERSQLIGRQFILFVPAESRSRFTGFLENVLASPAREKCEVELLNGGNSPLFMQIEAIAASNEECLIAMFDISERKRYEAEINKLNAELKVRTFELENANQELTAFNYMASHDLRQPLNNIFLSSQAIELLNGDKFDEESMGFLRIIKKGVTNMSELIGTLLNFSQTEHAELHRKMFDLSDLARLVVAALRLNEPKRLIKFNIDAGIKVNGDPALLRVALENLIGNAWKYTGKIKKATIDFGTMEIDGRTTYFVRDNGPGFDMQEAESLFLPFKRLQGSDGFKGHGIGLSTVERIIRRHGGKIWASAEAGKGATFFFTLGE